MGADAENFKIDPTTGEVITRIEFSFAGKRTYSFNVTATDTGGQRAVVQVSVQVLRYTFFQVFKRRWALLEIKASASANLHKGCFTVKSQGMFCFCGSFGIVTGMNITK